jgi:murein DD-endopeptidase MepM/ murein hydrolase activator NlpD
MELDLRRHAPLGRVRPRFATATLRSRPHAYAGRAGALRPEIYASDHAEGRRTGRFRWVLSTCLAAAVGALAILVAVAGSMDSQDNNFASLEDRLRQASLALRLPTGRPEGLRWAIARTDKMQLPKGATGQKLFIPEPVKQRRGQREYTLNRYYVRMAARLGPITKAQATTVPPLNSFKLYASTTPVGAGDRPEAQQETTGSTKVFELNGMLASEDGQELDAQEVADLVQRAQLAESETPASGAELVAGGSEGPADMLAPQTTVVLKTAFETGEASGETATRDLPPVKVQRGDTLQRLLPRLGAQTWQVTPMMEAIRTVLGDSGLQAGFEIKATVLPVPLRPVGELVRFTILDDDGDHKVTVTRRGTRQYKASATPVEERLPHVALTDVEKGMDNSLYASFYHLAAKHGIPDDMILQVLRIHAPLTDFSQRVRAGDGIELFFDLKGEERGVDGEVGDLLATFITAGGETRKYYRYRGADGVVDFYDAEGNTAQKFLMRLPVRTRDVRLTSGYGLRMHPLLRIPKMHGGEDWACAHGTPIMAAGNGVIEEAGPKGENGNYIRVRHANGYKTGYAHMSGFAPGVAVGVKVRQGQVIGYVGSTGLSSGPHVHFELWVKNQADSGYHHVSPGSMPSQTERQLKGKELADFKRERVRIDDLMRRNPVRSAQLQ